MEILAKLSEGGEGVNTELAWLLYLGIGLFFATIVAGWLSSAGKQDQDRAVKGAHAQAVEAMPKGGKTLKRKTK